MVLDFHGNPATAGLAVFSDGNHHMALEAVVRAFVEAHPDVGDVFYTTTPPAPLVDAALGNGLAVGNLHISRKPDVFIGPGPILDGLVDAGIMEGHAPFAESRGNVILVRKDNPKGIKSVADLLSDAVTLACSNPVTEKASYVVYRDTLTGLAGNKEEAEALATKISVEGAHTVHSRTIHHREVPQLLANASADAAIVYYHLALRYTRIFPDVFDMVDLGGVPDGERREENKVTRYHVGRVGKGNQWGSRFVSFLKSSTAQHLYEEHGLQPLS
jgi:ABC-type molybdate transport system substrate-binding protein